MLLPRCGSRSRSSHRRAKGVRRSASQAHFYLQPEIEIEGCLPRSILTPSTPHNDCRLLVERLLAAFAYSLCLLGLFFLIYPLLYNTGAPPRRAQASSHRDQAARKPTYQISIQYAPPPPI